MRPITSRVFRMMGIGVVVALCASLAAAQTTQPLRWDQKRIRDYPIYNLLIKGGSAGNGVPEVWQWEFAKERGKPFTDQNREANLLQLLRDYPDSDYADDALLLLARCKFLYQGDADGAIGGLYEVIQKHPKTAGSSWIAEDRLFNGYVMLTDVVKGGGRRNGWYGNILTEERIMAIPVEKGRDEWLRIRERSLKQLAYFEYWEAHPNWTEDEARYWIAWIIIKGDLKERMGEAEQVLRQIIQAEQRTKSDREAASKVPYGEGIVTYMDRTERKAHLLLIDLLLQEGKSDAAREAASDYVRLHDGHPSEEIVVRELVRKGVINVDR